MLAAMRTVMGRVLLINNSYSLKFNYPAPLGRFTPSLRGWLQPLVEQLVLRLTFHEHTQFLVRNLRSRN